MLQTPGVKDAGRRAVTIVVAGVALLSFILPSHRAVAQDTGWFSFGASSPRRATRVRRHRAPRLARQSDDATERLQKRKTDEIANSKKKAASSPAGPLFAVLSLSDQHISVYNSSGLVTRGKVSTGMPGHRTPAGIYSIIGRERYHRSNIYSGAPMPFMQRITWSGIALHLGVVPGYPASHGCIRLPAGFAQQLWGMTKIGERVVVSPHDVKPAEIVNPLLPVPQLQPAPALVTENRPAKVAEAATSASELPAAATKLLNPIEYARALKVRAAADVASATKAIKEYSERTGAKPAEIRKALAELRAAEAARAQAEAKLAAKTKALEVAKRPAAREAAETAKRAAEAHLVETTQKLDEAKASEALKTPEAREALEAEQSLKEARRALANAQAAAKEAERRVSPVSILVSKKDLRVYIRQGLAPVLDAPVKIRDPDVPLGTHVYIASSAQNGGTQLGWSVVSMPSANPNATSHRSRSERRHDPKADQVNSPPPSDAAQALERVDIPKEVRERISQLLWVGSSLIISDRPLSDETSDIGTDLVVTIR